ncbi:unnamed protein product [Closterium sp. Yama58-4]|nr:unnamed protein product [Closterium sp. Yama58-4]
MSGSTLVIAGAIRLRYRRRTVASSNGNNAECAATACASDERTGSPTAEDDTHVSAGEPVASSSQSSGEGSADAVPTPHGHNAQEAAEIPSVPDVVPMHPALVKLLTTLDSLNGGMGLSNLDKNSVLQLITNPELATVLMQKNVKNCRDVEKLRQEYLADSGRGYKSTTFYVEGFPPLIMLHRDPLRALADMLRHKHNKPGFRMGPRRGVDGETGQREFSSAETGTWWQAAQEYVGLDKIVAALIFYSDVTHLSNNGRKKAHPVVTTLGNIALPRRWGRAGHALLAILPIPPANMPSRLKVELFNACVAKLFEPLLAVKETGVILLDFDGIKRCVVPLLFAWACDYPESGKITCTLSGQGCQKPCSMCYVDKENLSSVHLPNNVRTRAQQQAVRDMAAGVPARAIDNPLKLFSTFDVDCAIWKWEVGAAPWGNPILAVMADIMHQADLGMLDHIIKCIRIEHPALTSLLDGRLDVLILATRINTLRFPKTGTYFRTGAQVAGPFEHRSVMQSQKAGR